LILSAELALVSYGTEARGKRGSESWSLGISNFIFAEASVVLDEICIAFILKFNSVAVELYPDGMVMVNTEPASVTCVDVPVRE
jgi:hypothetical protein